MEKTLKATFSNIILTPISEDDISEDQLQSSFDEESSLELFKIYSIGPDALFSTEFKVNSIVAVNQSYISLMLNDIEYTFVTPENILAVLR